MVKASLETIKKLQDKKYYICPFLTPSYLLCVESREMSYFYISEIFLETDTIEEEKDIIKVLSGRTAITREGGCSYEQ